MTAKIGLFYGSTTCYTEMAGEKIRDAINAALNGNIVELYDVGIESITKMSNYNLLILGIPTWDFGELQEDWEAIWDDLDQLDLTNTAVALYGLGDQVGYPEWFQDALGYLWTKVRHQGAHTVGLWPNQGYTFQSSKALTEDKQQFVGLSLDDENQFDLSDRYIEQWCHQIIDEFGLQK
jgi:flavodoxin II